MSKGGKKGVNRETFGETWVRVGSLEQEKSEPRALDGKGRKKKRATWGQKKKDKKRKEVGRFEHQQTAYAPQTAQGTFRN